MNSIKMNTFDDVTLVVEGQNIVCSKAILAKHSEYFKIMFEGHFSERDQNIITMNEIDFESLIICFKMFKNKSFIPEKENLLMAVQTACMLQFEDLIEIISYHLINNLDVDNCVDVWFFTERLNLRTVYLKAKRMALVEFTAVRGKGNLKKLEKKDLHKYLSNVHLVCKEFDVFYEYISWFSMNGGNIIEVLSCLDFNRLTDNAIADMLRYPDVRSSLSLVNVLKSVVAIRNEEYVENDLAQKLLNCNRRGYWIEPPFFEADEKHKVADDDDQDFWEALKLWMCQGNFDSKNVYKIVGHRHQIYLFRSMYQAGVLRFTIWIYDRVQKHWSKKQTIMLQHETVEMCINNNTVYVLGGGMHYRKNPLIWDSRVMDVFREDKWRLDIFLPVWGGNAKCCNYNDQLFIFYNETKSAYICDTHNQHFVQLYFDHGNFSKMEDEFTVYNCNDRIFLKDKTRLVQLRIESDELYVEKVTALSEEEPYEVIDKSLLCHDTMYSIRRNNNLVTVEGEMICRDQDDYRIGKARYVLDTHCKMLLPDDHMVCGKDKYLNTIENLFGN